MTRAENVNRCPDSAPVELCRDAELAGALRLVTVPVRDDRLGIAAIDSIAAWALRHSSPHFAVPMTRNQSGVPHERRTILVSRALVLEHT